MNIIKFPDGRFAVMRKTRSLFFTNREYLYGNYENFWSKNLADANRFATYEEAKRRFNNLLQEYEVIE